MKLPNLGLAGKILVWLFVVLLGVLIIDLLVQVYYNSPAAMVNGSRITYGELDSRLRQSYGIETVENLINEEIVMQEGTKQKVEVKDEQVKKEYDNYVATFDGGEEELLKQLKDQGVDKEELLRRIRITLTVNKLVEGRVKGPSGEDVQEYYDLKYSYLEEKDRPNIDDVRAELVEEIKQTELQNEIPVWLEEVRAESKVRNNLKDESPLRVFGLTYDLIQKALNSVKGDKK